MRWGDPWGEVDAKAIFAQIDADAPASRILSWTPEHNTDVLHHVMIDGVEIARTTDTELADAPQDARDHIEVIETAYPENADEEVTEFASTPLDQVRASWSEVTGAERYELYRKLGAGSYALIASFDAGQTTYKYTDGPLDDGVYTYKVTAYDAAGNSADSNEEPETISAAPDAPTDLAATVTAATVTLTWTASGSADVAHYNIYRNAGTGAVEFTGAVHAEDTASPWAEDMTGQTGRYEYLVRTEDSAANEEANLSQMVAVDLTSGAQVLRPNSPEIWRAEAITAGQIEVRAMYDRTGEAGVATSIRLYVNDGAGGAMDWVNSVGSVSLATGFSRQVVDVDSTGLTGGLTYLCGIRARTAAGVEDENTTTTSVTTDSTAPSGPTLVTDIV